MDYQELSGLAKGESSSEIRQRTTAARGIQKERFAKMKRVHCNADMGAKQVQKHCAMEAGAADLLKMAISELNFSARAYDRILRVSRTIADLDQSEEIQSNHVSEAVQYRTLDRQLWI